MGKGADGFADLRRGVGLVAEEQVMGWVLVKLLQVLAVCLLIDMAMYLLEEVDG